MAATEYDVLADRLEGARRKRKVEMVAKHLCAGLPGTFEDERTTIEDVWAEASSWDKRHWSQLAVCAIAAIERFDG